MRLASMPAHESAPGTLWQGMQEGLRFVWDQAPLRVALALEVVSGLFGHNITLITIIAKDVLGTGAQGLGWLLSALGAGGMLAMIFMVFAQLTRHMRVILYAGAIYSVLLAAFALSHWLALSVVLLFLLGTCDGIWGVNRNTLAQTLVPDTLRGRVMSVVVLTTRGSAPLGRLQAGALDPPERVAQVIGDREDIVEHAARVDLTHALHGLAHVGNVSPAPMTLPGPSTPTRRSTAPSRRRIDTSPSSSTKISLAISPSRHRASPGANHSSRPSRARAEQPARRRAPRRAPA